MGLETLASCIAVYHTQAAGVVSGQLIDQSGYGNHLDLITGTPSYVTRDGISMMNYDNTFWFEGENVMLSGGSVVVVGSLQMVGSEGSLAVVNTNVVKALGNNYLGNNESTDVDWFNSSYQIKSLYFTQARNVYVFDRTGVTSPGPVWTNAQANLFTGCFDIDTQTAIGARYNEASASNAVASGVTTAREGALIRIGHLRSTAGYPAGGGHCSTARLFFFSENIFNDPDFAAARDATIAEFSL